MLLHLSPLLLVLLLLLALRRPPLQAALSGCALALTLWALGLAGPVQSATLHAAALDTALLFAIAASVILPGLAFVIAIERLGVNQALGSAVQSLRLPRAQQVLLLVLGLGPMLESLTGFGVSLVATVPLLLALLPRPVGLRLALVGMAVMPWGTLGVATVVGASLAGLDTRALSAASAVASAPVFLLGAALSLRWAGASGPAAWRSLAGLGALFLAVLYGLGRATGPELAGVGAGLAVVLAVLVPAGRSAGIAWPRAAWPYAALVACVLALKALALLTQWDGHGALRGQAVVFKPLASPGIALLAALAWVAWREHRALAAGGHPPLLPALRARAQRPLWTILAFLALSQILVKGGFLQGLVQSLAGLPPPAAAPLVALLGALSGYLTGSTLGGNALFMPAVALLPEGLRLALAALHNSAAGHAAMGSIPIAMVALGLARATRDEEGTLVRFGFALACLNAALLALAGAAWVAWLR